MQSNNASVAIDGPAASGKTTVARQLARDLRYLYLDTGAMYRAVALCALEAGADVRDESAVMTALGPRTILIADDPEAQSGYRVALDDRDVTMRLVDADVTAVVSSVAAHPRVREDLVARQRTIAERGPVVMAGRDIGTVVLPLARHKFYLTASVDERVRRRALELEEAGRTVDRAELRADVERRDAMDEARTASPLRPAVDAMIIDSSDLGIDDVVARMLAAIAAVRA
jgi:cytidylate kinase